MITYTSPVFLNKCIDFIILLTIFSGKNLDKILFIQFRLIFNKIRVYIIKYKKKYSKSLNTFIIFNKSNTEFPLKLKKIEGSNSLINFERSNSLINFEILKSSVPCGLELSFIII